MSTLSTKELGRLAISTGDIDNAGGIQLMAGVSYMGDQYLPGRTMEFLSQSILRRLRRSFVLVVGWKNCLTHNLLRRFCFELGLD
jgi:hypothetical protein